jgi:hypothetical protein
MKRTLAIAILGMSSILFAQFWNAIPPTVEPQSTSFQDSLSITFSHPGNYVIIFYSLSNNTWDSLNAGLPDSIEIFRSCTLKTYAMVECTGWCFSDTIVEYYSKTNTSVAERNVHYSQCKNKGIDAFYDLSGRIVLNPGSSKKAVASDKNILINSNAKLPSQLAPDEQ